MDTKRCGQRAGCALPLRCALGQCSQGECGKTAAARLRAGLQAVQLRVKLAYLFTFCDVSITVFGLRLKCDGTCAETRFHFSAKRTSPFKSAGASVQSINGRRAVRISGSNSSYDEYTMFRCSVTSTGYPHHSPVSPSLPLPCVTVCHQISTGLYLRVFKPIFMFVLILVLQY